MSKFKEAALVLVLVAVSAVPRFVGLGDFTSIDEPFWLRVSGNFYYALGQHEFQNTLYEYHPAVTTMWIIAAGMLLYFPEYRSLGQGYLKPGKFDEFMLAEGKSLLDLLVASRVVQVIVVIALLLVVYWLMRRLFGSLPAFLSTGLLSLSPFFLGHSRLLNHEAMMALFLLISLLALLVYLYAEPRLWALILSGVAAALAQLTKSSGIVLFPVIALILLLSVLNVPDRKIGAALLSAGRTIGLWLVFLAAAYVLFWPGMWVAPGKMLGEVYGNALTYVFQGARVDSADTVEGGLRIVNILNGLRIYGSDLVWRATPLSWMGLLVGFGLALQRRWPEKPSALAPLVMGASLLSLLVVILFSIQRGPKPSHYTVTAYAAMDVIAGLGWWGLFRNLSQRWARFHGIWPTAIAAGALIALQLALAVGFSPYYITYYDPLVEALRPGIQNPILRDTGYGVGLDRAAAYLAKKRGAGDMTVMSVNGLGSFSYYFPGRTIAMNYLSLSDPLVVSGLKDSQYVVVDYYNQKRRHRLADLADVRPEKTIRINGIDFLRIYRSADILAQSQVDSP